jgi:hypothetical protein
MMAALDSESVEITATGETVASLFQPDTIAPAEYFDGFKRKSALEPERELVLALLEDAVLCFQKYLHSTREKEQRLFADTEEWLFGDDREWPLSFLNVCDLLGLEPGYVRKGLAQWKQKALGDPVTHALRMTAESKTRGDSHGRKNERDMDHGRGHPGSRRTENAHRRRVRAGAGARLAAVRKARAL